MVIEYCAVFGSEAFVMYAKDIIHRIRTLKEFIHVDDLGRDKGILVREKSKALVELLSDEALLLEARRSGVIPNPTRPKSAEPLLVDPKQRKRLGADNYDDMQNVDEAEALRIALEQSRRESGQQPLKYSRKEFTSFIYTLLIGINHWNSITIRTPPKKNSQCRILLGQTLPSNRQC